MKPEQLVGKQFQMVSFPWRKSDKHIVRIVRLTPSRRWFACVSSWALKRGGFSAQSLGQFPVGWVMAHIRAGRWIRIKKSNDPEREQALIAHERHEKLERERQRELIDRAKNLPLKIRWVSWSRVAAQTHYEYCRAAWTHSTQTISINIDPFALRQSHRFAGPWPNKMVKGLTISLLHELGHWAGRRTHGRSIFWDGCSWDPFLERAMYQRD